ncbi:hypothetical protein [Pleomorphovibrio marinus]|uniref:hypothetical protein n=1 Tax=Pleomorphovibrio marinus TaxID=2164132 RepID=UPI001300BBEC|nr:hypothetical protein [Pleomorphovibrio marinus]
MNLKEVGDFSKTSKTSIGTIQKINFGFAQGCRDRCRIGSMASFTIQREEECGCETYQEADSVLLRLQLTVQGYFDGLEKLSGNQLTQYDLSGPKRVMVEGDFGDWRISPQETEAYNQLARVIVNASTDAFRRKRLSQYIEEANAPLLALLEKMEIVLRGNLQGILDNRKSRLYGYFQRLTFSENLSDFETGMATKIYYEELDEIKKIEAQIATSSTALRKISEAHQVLFDNRRRLTGKDLKAFTKQYQSDLSDLIVAFNQLSQ